VLAALGEPDSPATCSWNALGETPVVAVNLAFPAIETAPLDGGVQPLVPGGSM
jgi:hypothetical protein